MRFAATTFAAVISTGIFCTETVAFSPSPSFVGHSVVNTPSTTGWTITKSGPCKKSSARCNCPSCTGKTALYADVVESESPDVPAEVVAMDGVESAEEAHNVDRPARESLKKKRAPRGKPLSEFNEGDMVKATVKSVASYGAFCDFGASSDGLLHISRMSKTFVSDVSDVIEQGQEVEVRIVTIDNEKNQVALSLLTVDEEAEANDAASRPKRAPRQSNRREDSATLSALQEKGFDSAKFVTGKVVSTVTFGAFVRVDASLVNEECEGEFDGLVHISSLTAGRANTVEEYAKEGQDVQIRVKSIGDGKVALSMVSVEDEAAQQAAFDERRAETEGAKDWKESLERIQSSMPVFENKPIIVQKSK